MEKAMTLPVRIRALRNCRAAAYRGILFLHAREIPGLGMEDVTCRRGCAGRAAIVACYLAFGKDFLGFFGFFSHV